MKVAITANHEILVFDNYVRQNLLLENSGSGNQLSK